MTGKKMDPRDMNRLVNEGLFSELDKHFASLMIGLSGGKSLEIFLASALLSRATSEGHVCLDLASMEGRPLMDETPDSVPFVCPGLSEWRESLESSPVVGRPGDYKPLVLDDRSRLYLYRYWDYEKTLADDLRSRAAGEFDASLVPFLGHGLERLFGPAGDGKTDWQEVATFTALVKRLCVISGGPGTGKSSVIARILALILANAGGRETRIALAAPTGKAAARLQEAVREGAGLAPVKGYMPEIAIPEASTIHRLLGSVKGSPYFRHNEENLLPFQTVIIDEASMVDLALMSKLVRAVPMESRLILLGDRDQLASVQAGSVLGDICDTGRSHGLSKDFTERFFRGTGRRIDVTPIQGGESKIIDCMVRLRKNYRFGEDSGIALASRVINQGKGDYALNLLKGGGYPDLGWKALPAPGLLRRALQDAVIKGYKGYLAAVDPVEALQLFERFRILCALRAGPYGVLSVNLSVERILREENLIDPSNRWYRGRPVMITRNDYGLGLFNGDIGIIMEDQEAGQGLRAFFLSPDGSMRKFLPQRLPEHETVYAVTVHKSQGSEFERALLLLPKSYTPVLTRELVYTGLTRARQWVEVWGRENVFVEGVRHRIRRASGLRDALWGG